MHRGKAGTAALTKLFTDKNWSGTATIDLEFDPNARIVAPVLMKLLKDKDSDVRRAAVDALGKIGPNAKAAIPALTVLLKDKDGWVRKAAAEALEKIKREQGTQHGELMLKIKK